MTTETTPPPLDLAALTALANNGSTSPVVFVGRIELSTLLARITAAESSLARYIVERTRFGDAMAADAVAPVVDAIMRELTDDTGKRARKATARAEAAEAKVAAGLAFADAVEGLPGGMGHWKIADRVRAALDGGA